MDRKICYRDKFIMLNEIHMVGWWSEKVMQLLWHVWMFGVIEVNEVQADQSLS